MLGVCLPDTFRVLFPECNCHGCSFQASADGSTTWSADHTLFRLQFKVSGLKEALSKSAFHWLVTMCRSPASKDLDTCYNDATVNTPQKDSLVYKFKSGPAGRWCHAPLIPGSL